MSTTAQAPGHLERSGPGVLQRMSDRCNPVLVRDVLQATRSKVFLGVMLTACAGLVLVTRQYAMQILQSFLTL